MKIFDLKMKIEECNLKKLEEEAEEAKEEESALEAAGAESVEGDGVAAGGETAQESENIANLTNDMANEMNAIIADILKEKVEKVGALILNKLGPEASAGEGAGAGEDGVNLDEGMEFDTMVEKDNYLKTPDNMTRSAGITPEVNQGVFRLK